MSRILRMAFLHIFLLVNTLLLFFSSLLCRVKKRVRYCRTDLVRRGSRGTNVNPFTPLELQSKAGVVDDDSDAVALSLTCKSEDKPHKVI